MSLIARDSGGQNYRPLAAGTYVARCVGLVDLGMQASTWQGRSRSAETVLILWELPEERMTREETGESEPRWISRRYTNSLHQKSVLLRDLTAWRGKPFTSEELKGFNLRGVVGAPCLLTVTNYEKDGRTYANISSVSRLMKGMECPPQESESLIFDMEAEDAESVFYRLPQWIQGVISNSPAWAARKSAFIEELEDDGDLPF